MTNTVPNQTPAADLAAIIARGVARYVESLPDFARAGVPLYHGEPVTDEEAAVEFNVSRVTEERQRELCLSCVLSDCVEVTDSRCPIRIEARRLWRKAKGVSR
jgi:hypothetical protein